MNQENKSSRSTIGLKVISVIMAVLLWFYVVNQGQIGMRKNTIEADLQYYNLPAGLIVSGPDTVTVKLWGAFKEPGKVVAYVDLAKLAEGEYDLPVNVRPVQGAMLTSVQPKKVKVKLKETGKNIVNIKYELNQNPPAGYNLLNVVITPDKCLIEGDQEAVKKVTTIAAPLKLGDVKDIASFKTDLVARDAQGNAITSGITLVPQTVEVYAVVEKKKNVKQLTINPQLTGKLAEGYEVTTITTDPDKISVLGDNTQLGALTEASTDKIDLTDKTESFSQLVNIIVPQGITATPSQVTVIIEIGKISDKTTQ